MARSKHLLLALFLSLVFHGTVIWLAIKNHQSKPDDGVARRLSVTMINALQASKLNEQEAPVTTSEGSQQTTAPPPDGIYPEATAASPMPLPVGPKFFNSKELNRRPEIISRMPDDPESIRSDPVGGSAVLEIWILESGLVARVIPVKSDLSASTLKGLADIFLQSRFAPGLIGNNPVNSIITIEVKVDKRAQQKMPPPPQTLQ